MKQRIINFRGITTSKKPMRLTAFIFFLLVAACASAQQKTSEDASQTIQSPIPIDLEVQPIFQKNYRPLIMAHYMPWYQTAAISGVWGWHWTMDHFNPNQKDENGKQSIASHYYPLTGPYDSSDDDVLEYQVLLMRISGVDGVIVDWYGMDDFWDYGTINKSTQKIFEHIEKAGLLFAITYEDQTIKHMLENGFSKVKDKYVYGQQVMKYLQENWFTKDAYLKTSERPVLLTFGNPLYFSSNSDWETLFSVLNTQPVLINEDTRVGSIATSSYPWPPMYLSRDDGKVSRSELESYLNGSYQTVAGSDYVVASAFPGFHDIYKEAGVGSSYGYLDFNDGETFEFTFQKALESDPDVIQVVTWNDYGEGTMVEPTLENGYKYLEIIQKIKRERIDGKFPYTQKDLTLPIQIYQLREQYAGNTEVNAQLDDAVIAVLAGRPDLAWKIIVQFPTQ